jgi:hypothetical protein
MMPAKKVESTRKKSDPLGVRGSDTHALDGPL